MTGVTSPFETFKKAAKLTGWIEMDNTAELARLIMERGEVKPGVGMDEWSGTTTGWDLVSIL